MLENKIINYCADWSKRLRKIVEDRIISDDSDKEILAIADEIDGLGKHLCLILN